MKKVVSTHKPKGQHWVGNGFPVRNMFGYNDLGKKISPFLLLDYAGPHEFPPSQARRGVGEHPHRGFETVTIIYSGEVEHRDSSGNSGLIGPGDVQWMTAGAGVLHEEMHSESFQKSGGRFEVVQLWVNLTAKHKALTPRYQTLLKCDIPVIDLPESAGIIRLIAGHFHSLKGPAITQTSVNVWDISLKAGKKIAFEVPEGQTAVVFSLDGIVQVCGQSQIGEAELAVLDPSDTKISLEAEKDSKILFLGGEPIHEPMVGLGPFVMNTRAEITQAFTDYDEGKFGHL
jgi:redox-sensitive bicupin YhaK (pirin superfamily)